jgi:dimethylhistidine N-methyltransferase
MTPTLTADARALFAAEVTEYLQRHPRQLPSKYFYDPLGTALFEAICRLPWYRITRAESALLARHAGEILAAAGTTDLVELGCGSGEKLATLLTGSGSTVGTIQLIDISGAALEMARAQLAPLAGTILTHQGSYEEGLLRVAARRSDRPLLVAFLGSNIGNFDPPAGHALLRRIRQTLRPGDALLLGSDLAKPVRDLLLAYDDPLQVTAAFNRNLLRRINDELGGTFELAGFAHRACWNRSASRIEMHLVSVQPQTVRIAATGLEVDFAAGESIWTESSYKYEPEAIVRGGFAAGFRDTTQWIDAEARFALTRFAV